MPIVSGELFLNSPKIIDLLRFTTVAILFLYALFALLIVRQVGLMSSTLVTPVSPVVKAVSILHAGFAVGLLVLIMGTL